MVSILVLVYNSSNLFSNTTISATVTLMLNYVWFSGQDLVIRLYLKLPENFIWIDSVLCIYHLIEWSYLNLLHNSQWIPYSTHSVLNFFDTSLLYSLIMWLTISPLSPLAILLRIIYFRFSIIGPYGKIVPWTMKQIFYVKTYYVICLYTKDLLHRSRHYFAIFGLISQNVNFFPTIIWKWKRIKSTWKIWETATLLQQL